jgi:hypothetical protein
MSFPPRLLDELARVFARLALDRLLNQSAAREPRQEGEGERPREQSPLKTDGLGGDVNSD